MPGFSDEQVNYSPVFSRRYILLLLFGQNLKTPIFTKRKAQNKLVRLINFAQNVDEIYI